MDAISILPTLDHHKIGHKGWDLAFEGGRVAGKNTFVHHLGEVILSNNCNNTTMSSQYKEQTHQNTKDEE